MIRLERDDWWPEELKTAVLKEIESNSDLCIEDCISGEFGPIYDVALELERFVRQNQLLVYHCTKEPHPGFYKENGLRCLDIKQHRKEFIEKFGHVFTDEERAWIQSRWDMNIFHGQEPGRNGKIWFCFTPIPVVGSGAERLLAHFGGEAIYIPLLESPGISFKLAAIGESVIVEVIVNPERLITFSSKPFALTSLTYFANRIDRESIICESVGYLEYNVLPEQIKRVVPKGIFFKEHESIIHDPFL